MDEDETNALCTTDSDQVTYCDFAMPSIAAEGTEFKSFEVETLVPSDLIEDGELVNGGQIFFL